MSLGEKGAVPDHVLSLTLCPRVSTQAGSSFALQELLLGGFNPGLAELLFTRWFFPAGISAGLHVR